MLRCARTLNSHPDCPSYAVSVLPPATGITRFGIPDYHTQLHPTVSLLTVVLTLSGPAWSQSFVPDHKRTPGAIDPGIKQENIADTICVPGYTKTVRPPSSYSAQLKREQMRGLRLPGTAQDYHEDHLVPLCVGGHPQRPAELMA